MMTATLHSVREQAERTLDAVEEQLPTLPRSVVRLNRSVASFGCAAVTRAVRTVGESTSRLTDVTATSLKMVTGQTRSAVERTTAMAARGANEATGQAKAQASIVLDAIDDEAQALVDGADEAVTGAETGSYESWTKADLYERAQELDIDGRSSMTKSELIEALVAAA